MDDQQWSKAGEPPTAFERALVEQWAGMQARDSTEQMLLLASRIGIDALCAVLDEFAGEKVHIPKRQNFFGNLYRTARDRAVRKALNAGQPICAIAAAFDMTRQNVCRIAKGDPADPAPTASRTTQNPRNW